LNCSALRVAPARGTAVALLCDMKNGLLSQIKIAFASNIQPFEWETAEEEVSASDKAEISVIRHPFPVIEIGEGKYLLLQDASRFYELLGSGLVHLPIQICSRKSVRVRLQRLGLVNFGYNDLARFSAKYPDQIILGSGIQPASGEFITVRFEFPYRDPVNAFLRNSTRRGCPGPLEQIFRGVLFQGRYVPILDRRNQQDGVFRTVTLSGTIILPAFDLEDLESAAVSDRLFPPNVVHVTTDSRVFNIDFPASVLRADISIDEKDLFLRDLITIREQSCRTTFFEGRVYILNR
jgi:hypothetical protein